MCSFWDKYKYNISRSEENLLIDVGLTHFSNFKMRSTTVYLSSKVPDFCQLTLTLHEFVESNVIFFIVHTLFRKKRQLTV